MSAAQQFDYLTYCPSCGEWDKEINPTFGWCSECCAEHLPDVKVCLNCKSPFVNPDPANYCWRCKDENYLRTNADRIEELEAEGYTSMKDIRQIIAQEKIRHCSVCGKQLQSGYSKHKHNFCDHHHHIGASYRRRLKKGMEPDKAFEEALAVERKPGLEYVGRR